MVGMARIRDCKSDVSDFMANGCIIRMCRSAGLDNEVIIRDGTVASSNGSGKSGWKYYYVLN